MQQILVLIGVSVGLAVLSWLVQQMKAAADRRQVQRDRDRQRAAAAERPPVERELVRERDRRPPPVAPVRRAEGSEVDRFMQEINRLRERAGAPPARPAAPPARPVAKAIPVVAPARKKPRLSEQAAPDTFPAGRQAAPPPPSRGGTDDLPMATVVGTAPRPVPAVAAQATPTSPPVVTAAPKVKSAMVDREAPMASPAGRQLVAMLKDKNSLAIAVLLQEVLGPPKAKRGM